MNGPAIHVSEHVVFEVLHDEAVLLNLQTGLYFSLNETGARIWELLVETSDLAQVVKRMSEEFEADCENIDADVRSLVTRLCEARLVQVVGDLPERGR